MKLITSCSGLLFAGLTSMALAKLGIESMDLSYKYGDIVRIYYWTDSEYSLITMELVVQTPDGWEACDTLFSGDFNTRGNDTFTWRVPNVAQGEYAISMKGVDKVASSQGEESPGYSAFSNRFDITAPSPKKTLTARKIVGFVAGGLTIGMFVRAGSWISQRRHYAARARWTSVPQERSGTTDSLGEKKEKRSVGITETSPSYQSENSKEKGKDER